MGPVRSGQQLRWWRCVLVSSHPSSHTLKDTRYTQFSLSFPCTIYPSDHAIHHHYFLWVHTHPSPFNHCPLLIMHILHHLWIFLPSVLLLITMSTFIESPYVPSITKGAFHMPPHSFIIRALGNRNYYLHLLDKIQENLGTCLGSQSINSFNDRSS